MKNDDKKMLLEKITTLIDQNNNTTINKKYLQYFEIEELKDIIQQLEAKKTNSSEQYLNDIFDKCS